MTNREMPKNQRRLVLFFFALLGLTAAGLTFSGFAQQDGRSRRATASQAPAGPKLATPTPTPTPHLSGTPGDSGQDVDPDEVITVDTNLVNLNVRVVDRLNRPISDVKQNEFSIYEDGVLQPISLFNKEEVPIAYGIAVDNSGSLRAQLTTVIDASKSIVSSNRADDETFIVRFTGSDNIELLQDFTANKGDLIDALEDKMLIEPGQTDITDAVYLAVERLGQFRRGNSTDDRRRRALILVTDGEERDHFHSVDQLFDLLKELDVQIYVIGFVADLEADKSFLRKSPQEKAVKYMTDLAEKTGGRLFLPKSLDELPGIANEITRDLRTQYVLSYYPTKENDGSYRAIRVTVADAAGKDKRLALTRPGRTASKSGPPPKVTPAPLTAPPKPAGATGAKKP